MFSIPGSIVVQLAPQQLGTIQRIWGITLAVFRPWADILNRKEHRENSYSAKNWWSPVNVATQLMERCVQQSRVYDVCHIKYIFLHYSTLVMHCRLTDTLFYERLCAEAGHTDAGIERMQLFIS